MVFGGSGVVAPHSVIVWVPMTGQFVTCKVFPARSKLFPCSLQMWPVKTANHYAGSHMHLHAACLCAHHAMWCALLGIAGETSLAIARPMPEGNDWALPTQQPLFPFLAQKQTFQRTLNLACACVFGGTMPMLCLGWGCWLLLSA